ncbi:hypothetical protein H2O64_19305 [Kordia sp. YSTF-M3]|uniref:Anti-sigma factor n=1 Tax=Kordia aestuariivivens TaxID=2759037 RepID=A0ABR7QE73_9FLAO|nr:hypothetical protein [Kordia aestuariivivens]MBC8756830.1 hypothetical protein [Kordia aestuariivivens]
MELANIENLLEKYFEATTTVQEEQTLQLYFSQDNVAPHLQEYQPMFQHFANLRGEQSTRNVPLKPRKNYLKWISVAAVFLLTTGLFFNEWNEQRLASEAFEDFKTTMTMVSKNFNNGASHINHLNQFTETTNKIFITENN